jgi:hypothetical protein
MASGVYNEGARTILAEAFRGDAPSGSAYRLYLFNNGGTSAVENKDHNTYSDLTGAGAAEASGGGYGESTVARNSTDFDVNNVDDGSNYGNIQLKDFAWTASGSSITSIYYAVLTDANATENSRLLFCFWDLSGPHTIPDGSSITLVNLEIRITT